MYVRFVKNLFQCTPFSNVFSVAKQGQAAPTFLYNPRWINKWCWEILQLRTFCSMYQNHKQRLFRGCSCWSFFTEKTNLLSEQTKGRKQNWFASDQCSAKISWKTSLSFHLLPRTIFAISTRRTACLVWKEALDIYFSFSWQAI